MNLPIGEAAALWRAYLSAFTALLSQMNGDPASPPGQRLVRFFFFAYRSFSSFSSTLPLSWGAEPSAQRPRLASGPATDAPAFLCTSLFLVACLLLSLLALALRC